MSLTLPRGIQTRTNSNLASSALSSSAELERIKSFVDDNGIPAFIRDNDPSPEDIAEYVDSMAGASYQRIGANPARVEFPGLGGNPNPPALIGGDKEDIGEAIEQVALADAPQSDSGSASFESVLETIRAANEGEATDSEVSAAIESHNLGGGIDDLNTRADAGVGGVATTRAESLQMIESYLRESGVDLSDKSGLAAWRAVRSLPGTGDGMGVNSFGRAGLEFEGATDEFGAAPDLFGPSRSAIGDGLAELYRRGAEATDRESGRRDKVARRRLREAARERVEANPDISLDDVSIDARVGDIGTSEPSVIIQDPETGRTESFDIDLDDGTDAAAGSALDQFDPTSGAVDPAAGSTRSGSSIGGGTLAIAAAAVGLAAIALGGN